MYDSLSFEFLGDDGNYHTAEVRLGDAIKSFFINGVEHEIDPFSFNYEKDVGNENAEEPE